ncbi:hypothetical protein D7V93_21480 [Corallococcus llansteffanensis]|uniref:Uncharacterized protein n=2 Tax=Corallococcus llansteffanensis TaxID=2316731 RepID=A0A3A8PU50_9BACT|nr:hypothetical protein D7V93_21480 [Corallococcus llansteffanensis]
MLSVLTLAPASALAEPEQPVPGVTYVFATVDAYSVKRESFEITGTLVGENTPRVFYFGTWHSSFPDSNSVEATRCDRLALLAMTRPGRYLLSWTVEAYYGTLTCTLARQ